MSTRVCIWRCDLDREIASAGVLDERERQRAAAFAFEHLRKRYAAAHYFLRAVLGETLGIAPQDVRFSLAEHGKPYLTDHALAFNLSHAQGVAYVAIASGGQVGIDVELHHRIDDLMAVARTVFSPAEMIELDRASDEGRTSGFLRCWTRKEAYVKALGIGLGARLVEITVHTMTDDIAIPPIEFVSDASYYIRSIASPAGEYVAIASSEPIGSVEVRRFGEGGLVG